MDRRRLRRPLAVGDPEVLRGRGRLRLLLDTHVLLWFGDARLDTDSAVLIGSPTEAVYVSAATIWEIEIKRAAGKLRVAENIVERTDDAGFERLPITFEHARAAGRLPLLHRDPFDRLLVAQAQLEGLTIATGDPDVMRYAVPTIAVERSS